LEKAKGERQQAEGRSKRTKVKRQKKEEES
jgi:hypothetical protein